LPGTLEGFEVSLERLEAGLKTSPTDPMFLEEQALVLLEIARRTSDPADLSLALDALELLDASDPNNPRTELAHGIALALDGRATSGISEPGFYAGQFCWRFDKRLNLRLGQYDFCQ